MPVTLNKRGGLLLVQGLDVSKPAEYIGEQSSPNVKNYTINRALLSKRVGTSLRGSTIGGTDLRIMRGRQFNRAGTFYNVRVGQDHIEHYSSGTWNDITGTTLTGAATDLVDTAVPLLSGSRILCITNGVDNIRKWNASGNTSNLGGSPPVAKFIQEYETYLVCANIGGGTDITQRVQWSDTADPETWTGGNSGSVDLVEDGDDITGLNLFSSFLCVHKQNAIYLGALVSTSKIFRFDRRQTVGTAANASIVNISRGLQAFVALDGIRLFDGSISNRIPATANDEIRDSINKDAATKSWGVLVDDKTEVWFGIPIGASTIPDTVYKYNYETGAVYKDERADLNACWLAKTSSSVSWDAGSGSWDSWEGSWNSSQDVSGAIEIHFGDTYGLTTVSDVDSLTDNGTTIDAIYETKDFKSDDLGQILRFQEVWLWAKGSGNLCVEYSVDEGQTWTECSGSPIALDSSFPSESDPMRVYMDDTGVSCRLRFRHNESGSCQIKQFFIGYVKREYM